MSYRAGESLVGLGAPRAHYIAWPGALCCGESGEAGEAGERVLHGVLLRLRRRTGAVMLGVVGRCLCVTMRALGVAGRHKRWRRNALSK